MGRIIYLLLRIILARPDKRTHRAPWREFGIVSTNYQRFASEMTAKESVDLDMLNGSFESKDIGYVVVWGWRSTWESRSLFVASLGLKMKGQHNKYIQRYVAKAIRRFNLGSTWLENCSEIFVPLSIVFHYCKWDIFWRCFSGVSWIFGFWIIVLMKNTSNLQVGCNMIAQEIEPLGIDSWHIIQVFKDKEWSSPCGCCFSRFELIFWPLLSIKNPDSSVIQQWSRYCNDSDWSRTRFSCILYLLAVSIRLSMSNHGSKEVY